MPRKRYDDWRDYEQGDYESRRSDLGDDHAPTLPVKQRWRWNAPMWIPVVGAWIIVFLLSNQGIGIDDVSPYSSAVAGVVATLVWTWEERRTAAGMMKALIFGGVLAVVGFFVLEAMADAEARRALEAS